MGQFLENLGNFAVVLGSQWGDEGKGKLIDILAKKYDIVARATGGANAGHTIYLNGKKHVFHLVPSGMLNENCLCVIGNGVVLHFPTLIKELQLLEENGVKTEDRLLISNRAHILFEYHKIVDGLQEEGKKGKRVGSTKRGIGPCYTDKMRRTGIRVHELMDFEKLKQKYQENLENLQSMYGKFEYDSAQELSELKEIVEKIKLSIIDSVHYLNSALKDGRKILVEGANGALLDIDHGTYPYVTSSNPTIGGIATGLGLPPTKITEVIGIMKAYTTRVGEGPFPTEILDELGNQIREAGGEYGSTTGRPRRCGWFDAVVGKFSVMVNGTTDINLTKIDVLTGLPTLKIATAYKHNGRTLETFPADLETLENIEIEYLEMPGWTEDLSKIRNYEDLPENAKRYIEKIEELINCKITSIGVGVDRNDMIFR